MPRVLVTPSVFHGMPGPYRNVLEAAGFEVVYPPSGFSLLDKSNLLKQLKGIDAVMASIEPYDREVLSASKLRVVARCGVGYDAVDVAAATEMGIAVTTTPGTNEHSVAEFAIALICGVSRGLPARHYEVLKGKWTKKALPRLAGQTLGLVGLGRIGKALVPRALGLGLQVIACDPYADTAFAAQHQVRLCKFEELLETADIVSLHLPATADTNNLMNAQSFARMKPGSVLINTARGALVDEDALVAALKSGHLRAAGLDVFKIEPLPLDSPLLALDNILMTPHMAGLDLESQEAMGTLAAECIAGLCQGRWPEGCVVNSQLRTTWKW